ncbi:MAG: hypothetical protein R6U11_01645 [Bacteroidales bacterium]
MRKNLLTIILLAFISIASFGQKAEVLYFKANLPCCPAKACNQLEADIKEIIKNNFSDDEVIFKTIKIADKKNSELINKHNAKSQTVVIVSGETAIDVSDIVKTYSRKKNKEEFKSKLIAQINKSLE